MRELLLSILITCVTILNFFLNFNSLNGKTFAYKSILIVENNIPNECGIEIIKDQDFVTKLSIKKIEKPKTAIQLSVESKNSIIENFNIKSNTINLETELIKNDEIIKPKFNQIVGNMDFDKINILFQELFISGGELIFNGEKFILKGPIDSKVRLEYLFCVGEMFHPKYDN